MIFWFLISPPCQPSSDHLLQRKRALRQCLSQVTGGFPARNGLGQQWSIKKQKSQQATVHSLTGISFLLWKLTITLNRTSDHNSSRYARLKKQFLAKSLSTLLQWSWLATNVCASWTASGIPCIRRDGFDLHWPYSEVSWVKDVLAAISKSRNRFQYSSKFDRNESRVHKYSSRIGKAYWVTQWTINVLSHYSEARRKNVVFKSRHPNWTGWNV
jgi:hypothetical protein